MWSLAVPQAEAGLQVAGEHLFVLDGRQNGLVDRLLVGRALRGRLLFLHLGQSSDLRHFLSTRSAHLWLLSLLDEGLLALFLLALLFPAEVLGACDLVQCRLVKTTQVDLGRCGNNISGVYSPQWDPVDLEWPGDEQGTLLQVLEEDDALAAKAASKEDQNGPGLKGRSQLRRPKSLAGLSREGELAVCDGQSSSRNGAPRRWTLVPTILTPISIGDDSLSWAVPRRMPGRNALPSASDGESNARPCRTS